MTDHRCDVSEIYLLYDLIQQIAVTFNTNGYLLYRKMRNAFGKNIF